METRTSRNENASFLHLTRQRERAERMDKLFVRAVGDEDISKRQENVKHFDLGANRYQAVVYPEPVHFRSSVDSDWQEIDNTLEETVNAQGRAVWKNRANRLQVEFPKQMDGDSMATIADGGMTFSWRFEREAQPVQAKVRTGAELKQERLVKQAQKMTKFVGRTIDSLKAADLSAEIETEQERRGDIAALKAENVYENVLPGVSVRYTLCSDKVKEDIILQNAEALEYAARRLPKAFDYEAAEDGTLLIRADGRIAFTMDPPFVYDAAGHETVADIRLADCGEYIRLEYALDATFLAEAQFPVVIDPVINSTNAVHNIQDTTLTQGSSAKPYTDGALKIGTSSSKRNVALLKFNSLAIPSASDTIISAVLQMAPKSSSNTKYIAAYEVLKSWESASVAWTNFNPDLSTNVSPEAIECIPGSSNAWLSFDLTNLYRKWITKDANGASRNNGVAFRTPLNISGTNYSELYSSDASPSSYRPVMYVNYVSHAGIEGWWQYEQMGAGRAGVVYSDLFNGNMVLGHSDTVMTGNRNPVSVSHYYNSCLSAANDVGCGYGWKTDAHQKVTARTHNSRKYLVWEDGDGTEHFFDWSGSQPYKDCEGMELEMSFNSAGTKIFIYDKEHNGLRFNVLQAGLAWLEATTDAHGNVSTYSYVSGHEKEGRLDKITDCANRVTQFSYDSNGMLSSIRIPAAASNSYRYVYYTYDSAKRLTGVRYSELGGTTAHTTYGYDGSTNLLTRARNYDGAQVNIGYESASLYNAGVSETAITAQMRRVVSLETVSTNSAGTVTARGAKELFEYKHMCTEVTAVENAASDAGKKLYYQFNDAGNVTCVRDDLGFAKFTKFDSAIENRPSEESRLRKVVVNRLRKPDFGSQWDDFATGGTIAKDSTNTCLNCKSVKMTKTGAGETIYRQPLDLEAGVPFTFSAYVKTSALANGSAFLRIREGYFGTDYPVLAVSDALTGTTAVASGNQMPTDGWERIRVTLDPLAEETPVFVELVCDAKSGTAWFACPQVETGVVANAFNVVSNGDFRYTNASGAQTLPLDWTKASNTLSTAQTGVFPSANDPNFPDALEGNYLAVEGVPNVAVVGFVQAFDMKGKAGDVFTLGGWADSRSVPHGSLAMRFTLLLRVKKTDGSWGGYSYFNFNEEWVGWQFASFAAAASDDYQQVELTVSYVRNCNVSKFTNIFLHREAFGASYAYDDDKNLISVSNLAGQKSDMKYDSAKNLTIYTQPGRDSSVADNQYWAYYGPNDAERKKHLPWRTRTPMHMTDYFTYDSYGNPTASRRVDYRVYTEGKEDSAYPYMRTESTYTADGNYTATTKDARGNVVKQDVNVQDGTLTSVTDPTGQKVSYTYDASKRVTAVQTTGNGKTYKNAYTYENDRIKTVSHNTTSDTSNDVTYTFAYDSLGRKTTVKVGTQTLSTNVYSTDRSGLLKEVQYGNGGKVKYSHDEFDRLTGVTYDGESSPRYEYRYGANGQISEVEDNSLGRVARTDYDLADRPCMTELRDASTGEAVYKALLKYDRMNHLETLTETAGGETHRTFYSYDRDNRALRVQYDGSDHRVNYAYDALGRMTSRTVKFGSETNNVTSTYGYEAGGYGTNSTSALVKSITQPGVSFAYTYDSRGNIISEKRGTLTTTYAYDALGQLIRVNDPHENVTWVYNYDRGGNILSKVKYAYTTGTLGTAQQTISYTYGDSNWKDKLTAYNGKAITYDAIGNPLSDGTWTYTWQAGRQLKQMSKSGTTVQFKYDHNGLRTQKVATVNGSAVTTNYVLHGKLLMHMTQGSNKLHFFYDAQSRPVFVEYNGMKYVYVLNLQGDIVALLDINGATMVEYKYDAWGKPISTTGTMADTLGKLNPFRYRGYVYDEETGLYYLRSRYYNPTVGRINNADTLIGSGTLLSHNIFCYCVNNSVQYSDPSGMAVVEHSGGASKKLWQRGRFKRKIETCIQNFISNHAKEIQSIKKILKGAYYLSASQQLEKHGGGTVYFEDGTQAVFYSASKWVLNSGTDWTGFYASTGISVLDYLLGKKGIDIQSFTRYVWIREAREAYFSNVREDVVKNCIASPGSKGLILWMSLGNGAPLFTAWDDTQFNMDVEELYGSIEMIVFFEE